MSNAGAQYSRSYPPAGRLSSARLHIADTAATATRGDQHGGLPNGETVRRNEREGIVGYCGSFATPALNADISDARSPRTLNRLS